MKDLTLQLEASHWRPGETLTGSVAWSRETPPTAVEVRLFWYTVGASPLQIGMVGKTRWTRLEVRAVRRFEFTLPSGPLSFRGHLTGLGWAVEAILLPSRASAMARFVMSAGGGACVLHREPLDEAEGEERRIG